MFKFHKYFYILLFLLYNLNPVFSQQDELNVKQKISAKLNLSEIKIIITEISYEKELIAKNEAGKKIIIDIDHLHNLFLNRAIEINGSEVNYSYLYEYVTLSGQIISNNLIYNFTYNLAGYGSVWKDGSKKYIDFADPDMELPLYK